MSKLRKGEVKIYKGEKYIAIPEIETAENFGCEYMDVDDFVDKYKG